jgi:hypothetical protein
MLGGMTPGQVTSKPSVFNTPPILPQQQKPGGFGAFADKMFFGGGDPQQRQRNMMMMGAGMLANSGARPGQPTPGFGQALGKSYLGMATNAQDLEQIAMRNKQMQQRTEEMQKRSEIAEKSRAEAQKAREAEAQRTHEWRTKQAELEARRHQETIQSREKIAGMRGESSKSVLEQLYGLEQKAAQGDEFAKKALNRYMRMNSSTYGSLMDPYISGNTGEGDQTQSDAAAIAAQMAQGGAPADMPAGSGAGAGLAQQDPVQGIGPLASPEDYFQSLPMRQKYGLMGVTGLPQMRRMLGLGR